MYNLRITYCHHFGDDEPEVRVAEVRTKYLNKIVCGFWIDEDGKIDANGFFYVPGSQIKGIQIIEEPETPEVV